MSPLPSTLIGIVALLAVHSPQAGDEEAAEAELESAQAEIDRGRYEKALQRLERLAEAHPRTHAGRSARDRIQPNGLLGWSELVRHGPSANRLDVVVLGDGYVLSKQRVFDDLAEDVPAVFEHNLVFGEYYSYLNFLRGNVVSVEDGMDGYGREANTALGGHVIPGSRGDHAWIDTGTVHAVLNRMPEHDGLAIVFLPQGLLGAGGFGIAAVGGRDVGMLLHQWGHAFGTLKDEFSIDNGFLGEPNHWVNVSNTADPAKVPWKHWLEAGVSGIGIHAGADGRLEGAWKPTASGCRMETGARFCPVCREALVLRLYAFVDPIEAAAVVGAPEAVADTILAPAEEWELAVTVMRPTSHELDVAWYVLPADQAPRLSGNTDTRPRTRRRALPPIEREPDRRTHSRTGVHRFRVEARGLEPGLYRVLCRVRDGAQPRGERHPWVLKDEYDLLASERGWWIEVGE